MHPTCGSLFIYASNEPKSVLARDLGDCRVNEQINFSKKHKNIVDK